MWIGLFQKKPKRGVELRTLSFREYLKKSMWEFQGSVKIEMEFPSVSTKKLWNFHGSWLLALEFPRGVTQFCRISQDKVTNVKILGFFFPEKYILIPFFCIFSGIAHQYQGIYYPTKIPCCKLDVTSTKCFKLASYTVQIALLWNLNDPTNFV